MKRIGIYAGTFNPVHAGHIGFALQAIKAAQLDAVYFLPERKPRQKIGVEHFAHRVAMLKRATWPHRRLKVLELEDVSFTVKQTMPRLLRKFGDAQLVFLVGSDVVNFVPTWPNAQQLLQQSELVIGIRSDADSERVQSALNDWAIKPQASTVIQSVAPAVSSSDIREALYQRSHIPGMLKSVQRYSNKHWLYVSVA